MNGELGQMENLSVIITVCAFGATNLLALLALAFRLGRRDQQIDDHEVRITRLEGEK